MLINILPKNAYAVLHHPVRDADEARKNRFYREGSRGKAISRSMNSFLFSTALFRAFVFIRFSKFSEGPDFL